MSDEQQFPGRWYAGMPSPNPGGRPKAVALVADLARQHTESAITTLVTIMNDDKATRTSRIAAASALLDRGWGRPMTTTALVDPDPDALGALTPGSRWELLDVARRVAFVLAQGLKVKQGQQDATDAVLVETTDQQ